jgi:hypothetical protein
MTRSEIGKRYRDKHKEEIKAIYLANKEKNREKRKEYYEVHKDTIKARVGNYRQEHKEERAEYAKEYCRKNADRLSKQHKKYYQAHKPEPKQGNKAVPIQKEKAIRVKMSPEERRVKAVARARKWAIDNRERRLEWNKKYRERHLQRLKERNKTDVCFSINRRMATAIRNCLKEGKYGWKWEDLVGYTVHDLKNALEKTVPKGYTWQDFLSGDLQIDHKIPKSRFKYASFEDEAFRKCWSIDNLQLLPASENKRKSAKIVHPEMLKVMGL